MPRITTTPGVVFLAKGFLRLAKPVASVVIFQRLTVHAGFAIPLWMFFVAFIVGYPLYLYVSLTWEEIAHQREAKAMGARLAPRIKGKWLGDVDLIFKMLKIFKEGYPLDAERSMAEEKGPIFRLRMAWKDLVFTTCPEHIQRILATDFNNFEKGAGFQSAMGAVLGSGIFNSDGEMWKFHRGMSRPFFSRDRVTDMDLFDRHTKHALSEWKRRADEGFSIDFQDLMARFTLDSATEFLFGNCVDSLSAGLPYPHNAPYTVTNTQKSDRAKAADDFAAAFWKCQELIAERERTGGIWPLFEILRDNTVAPMKVVNSYLEPIIREAIAKQHGTAANVDGKIADDETLIDHLVRLTDDPVVLKDETLNILIAGRDTTSATLTFIVHFLAKYPKIMARLRQEVLGHVGPSRAPTMDDVKDMKYLRAVINETLRLYPIVPSNVRDAIKGTVWPSPDPDEKPIYIPARTRTPYSVFLMHRRTDLWGPDANEFDPDRWLDERFRKYVTPKPFIFLPFNAGPRICLGQQFAYNEMSFMLVRLMQNFVSLSLDVDACPPEFRVPKHWKTEGQGRQAVDDLHPKISLTMCVGGGLWVKATAVDNAEQVTSEPR